MILSEKLKFVVCLGLIMSVAPIASVADEADSIRAGLTRENALHPGMYSFIFQIDEQFTLRPFNGMGIALKRHSSRKSAFRLGFGLDMTRDNIEDKNWREEDDTISSENFRTREANSYSVRLELLYVMYPWPDSYVNFYWGTGPLVRFSWANQESRSGYLDSESNVHESWEKYNSRSWIAGAKGVVGVEWFANRRISFQMEYQAELYYQSGYYERESGSYQNSTVRYSEDTSYRVVFDAGTVIFGVSMYF